MVERLRVRIPSSAAEDFSSPELNLCADSYLCPFHPRDTAVARIRIRSFCQKCRWQVTPKHENTSINGSLSGLTMPLPSGNKFTRSLSGNIRPQSSQLALPLWTDPGIKSGISVHELNTTFKKSACGE